MSEPTFDAKPILPMSDAELETYRLHRRFDRIGRLVGDTAMKKLMASHVTVIGLGGVGSWTAESLVRSGIGKVTIVDFDEVCVTNFNRQLHALRGTVGKPKAEILAARLRDINPAAVITPMVEFYNSDHRAKIFAERPDYVVDAIDHITAKCHLIGYCRDEGIPVITSTGTGGRMDPTMVRVTDLGLTTVDPLARAVRGILRAHYDFPKAEGAPFGIQAVYSAEPAMPPRELDYDGGKGFRCVCPQGENPYFNCDNRNVIMGNAGFVTGTFGFVCAGVVVRQLAGV